MMSQQERTEANDQFALKLIREGILSALDDGSIFNHRCNHVVSHPHNYSGYMRVQYAYRDEHGKRVTKTFKVHRLVYLYHHGSIPAGCQIDHADENKHNNRISNLEAVTQNINVKRSHSSCNRRPPMTVEQLKHALDLYFDEKYTPLAIAKKFDRSIRSIDLLIRGKRFSQVHAYREQKLQLAA